MFTALPAGHRAVSAGLLTAAAVVALSVAAQPAAALLACPPASPVWVNSALYEIPGSGVLRSYDVAPDGSLTQAGEVPLGESYGDIALTPEGVMYGAAFLSTTPALDTLSTTTGELLAAVPITFAAGGQPLGLNTLSATSDGALYLAGYEYNELWRLDPNSGVISPDPVTTFPQLSTGATLHPSGDVLRMPDGDLLVLVTTDDATGYLLRVTAGVSTVVGSTPLSFGAALSGGMVFLAGADGIVRTLDSIPTQASEAPLPVTVRADTGLPLWGATSMQDAGGGCSPVLPATGADPAAALWVAALLAGVGVGAAILARRRAVELGADRRR